MFIVDVGPRERTTINSTVRMEGTELSSFHFAWPTVSSQRKHRSSRGLVNGEEILKANVIDPNNVDEEFTTRSNDSKGFTSIIRGR